MPYRTFTDSLGTDWQVWDIVPRLSERRSDELTERRVNIVVVPFADRRRDPRRLVDQRRAVLRGTFAQGWLCFESDTEKRRLSPIPEDWTICGEEKLEAYIRDGERVSGAYRMVVDEGAEPPLAEAG